MLVVSEYTHPMGCSTYSIIRFATYWITGLLDSAGSYGTASKETRNRNSPNDVFFDFDSKSDLLTEGG